MILLNQIKIASPCHASWDEMTGDAQVRFCGHCQKNVYNLSEMTRKDAQNLLAKSGAPPCVRFYKRADGTMLTQDCPVGKRRLKKRNAAVSYAALAAPLVLLTNGVPLKFSPPAIPPASATMGAPPASATMGAPPVPLLGKIAAPPSGARGKPSLPPKKAKGASKKPVILMGKPIVKTPK